jgi:hypothetical protein
MLAFATGIIGRENYQNPYKLFPIRIWCCAAQLDALILAIRRVATISSVASW